MAPGSGMAPLTCPVIAPAAWITRLWGARPDLYAAVGWPGGHAGCDIAASRGTAVLSMSAGVVVHAGPIPADPHSGTSVIVWARARGELHHFAHLDSVSVAKGQGIGGAGVPLGAVGNTGTNSDGNHLHVGIAPVRLGSDPLAEGWQSCKARPDSPMRGWDTDPLPLWATHPRITDEAREEAGLYETGVSHAPEPKPMFADQAPESTQGTPDASMFAAAANKADPFEPDGTEGAAAKAAKLAGGNVRKATVRGGIGTLLAALIIQLAPGVDPSHIVQFVPLVDEAVAIVLSHGDTQARLEEALARIDELEAAEPQTVYRDAPESAPAATPEPQPATAGDLCLTVLPPSDGSYWRVRTRPGIERDNWDGGYVLPGDSVCLVDSVPVQAGGHLWQEIRLRDGTTGWVSGEALMAPVRERGSNP